MYRIEATNPDGASYVIYDPVGSGPLPVLAPRITEELNEAGSLEFALVYGHLAFGLLHPKQTYFTVTLDGEELFYGRLLNAEPSPLGGQIQYIAAGALSFLQDGEMEPDSKNEDGSYNYQTMTAEAFFRRCINAYNNEIGNDPRRVFYVGTINHSDKNKEREYQINSYTNFSELIRQNIIDRYGGFLRVRKRNEGGHYIDWVSQYGAEDNAVLSIGQNILSITNRMEGEDLITAIRPVGHDGLVLSGSQTLDIFPNDQMAKYGKIVRSVQLGAAETESELRSQAQALIAAMHKSPPKTSEIGLVDLHFADSANHGVNLGDVFNHIAGLEGERMTVAARNRDCENPQNDSVTLKNPKQLEGSYDISDYKSNRSSGYSSGTDTLSRQTARAGGGAGQAFKYIHETQDRLELATKNIAINAENLELHADMFVETANEFARLSHVTGTLETEIGVIEGTGVIQNSDFITNLAGQFQYDPINHTVSLISGTEFRIMKSGAYITVGDRLTELTDAQARFEGSALWTQRNAITGVVGEFDVITGADGSRTLKLKSGTELKITKNGADITVGEKIVDLSTNVSNVTGSALWTRRDAITGVVGEFDVVTDGSGNRSLQIKSGTELKIMKNGAYITVGDRITDLTTNMTTVTGSALWTQRNAITGVVGEFEVVTSGGVKTLKVKSGGGLVIQRNNVSFGVYDSGNLTGGIVVDKINQGTDGKQIQGTRVNITANQVLVGSTSNVAAWMSTTGDDIDNLEGLVADRATIAQLNALKATVDSIDANFIKSKIASLSAVTIKALAVSGAISCSGRVSGSEIAGATLNVGGSSCTDLIKSASVSGNTLTLTYLKGSTVTFSKAITSAVWGWSNGAPKVTLNPQKQSFTGTDPVDDVFTNGNPTWAENKKSFQQPLVVKSEAGTTIITTKLTFYANEAYTAGVSAGVTASAPTGATLGSKVTGATWNVNIQRGSGYSTVGKQIDLTNAYTDARSGYYTTKQYNDHYTQGVSDGAAASVPTGATLGSKVTGATWNVSIQRDGGYSTVGKQIDLTSAYNDARSGYYTKAEYDANYKAGWNDCIDNCSSGYYLDGYTTYNGGKSTYLYVSPNGGAAATGGGQIWRYGGKAVLRYTIPNKKS